MRDTANVVIPFPARPEAGPARLARAMVNLQEALDVQKAAVARWRAALVELHSAVADLGTSLQAYSGVLAKIGRGAK